MTQYSGSFTLQQQMQAKAAGTWPDATDPNFKYVTMLLNGDGTNGAQNNTFLDSSTNNFTITRNGNTTQGSFSPYGSLWSLGGCSGSSDYLQMDSNAGLQLGSGDFTVECWAYFTTVGTGGSSENVIMDVRPTTTSGAYFNIGLSDQTVYWDNGTLYITTPTVSLNTWLHIAYVRNSGNLSIYINGSRVTTPTSDSTNYTCGSTNRIANLSYFSAGNRKFNGNISNLRIVKGTAVYTGTSFTVPTAPLTAISGTSLLTLQSNRWIDNSSNAIPISVNGLPQVQRFSPFEPSAAYSTSVIGGSGYFDGTDYLAVPTNSTFNQPGNFTTEYWAYFPNNTNYREVVSKGESYITIQHSSDSNAMIRIVAYGTATIATGGNVVPNQWNHFALVRNGSTVTAYLNGVSTCSGTYSNSNSDGDALLIGAQGYGGLSHYVTGSVADVRLTNSAVYTTTFTPPTAPLTAITNTSLLTNFTNAGIPDLAMQNNLETVGNAQVSTSVVKYGTGSLSFGGGANYLIAPNNQAYAFNTGNFTMECWYYSGTTTQQTILDTRNTSGGPGVLMYTLSNTLRVYSNAVEYIGSISLPSNTWTHLVVERISGALYTYVNGVRDINGSSYSANLTDSSLIVGYDLRFGSHGMNGYLDDIRITKGLARYSGPTFTPPVAALPTF
jgi:hypothetical protein